MTHGTVFLRKMQPCIPKAVSANKICFCNVYYAQNSCKGELLVSLSYLPQLSALLLGSSVWVFDRKATSAVTHCDALCQRAALVSSHRGTLDEASLTNPSLFPPLFFIERNTNMQRLVEERKQAIQLNIAIYLIYILTTWQDHENTERKRWQDHDI